MLKGPGQLGIVQELHLGAAGGASGPPELQRERLKAAEVMDSDNLRSKGNAAFTAKKFDEAVALYTLVSTVCFEGEEGGAVGMGIAEGGGLWVVWEVNKRWGLG